MFPLFVKISDLLYDNSDLHKFATTTAPSYETRKQRFFCSDYCCDGHRVRFVFSTAAVLLAIAVPSEITAPIGMPPEWYR